MKQEYKAYFIDLDGTMYMGKNRIPSAEEFIARLQAKDIPFLFVTNNATKTTQQVADKLHNHYHTTVEAQQVYTSAVASVDYLLEHHPGAKIFLLGSESLAGQLVEAGFTLVDENPDVVLQSLDSKVDYQKLETATLAIRNGADFIVTNIDSNIPNEKGLCPGSGATTAFLKCSTGQEPVVIGKPSAIIMEGALHHLNEQLKAEGKATLTKDEIVMVGDNYTTDIMAGVNFEMDTLMVLTGFSDRDDLLAVEAQPTHIVSDLTKWEL